MDYDLLIEFYEDLFEKDEELLFEYMNEHEEGIFFDDYHEDPLIAKWEREIRSGIMPDLTEGMSDDERAKAQEAMRRAAKPQTKKPNLSHMTEAEKRLHEALKRKGTGVLGAGDSDDLFDLLGK